MGIKAKNKPESHKVPKTSMRNVIKRSIITIAMIPSFIALCKCQENVLVLFVTILGALVYREIVSISKQNNKYLFSKFIVFGFAAQIYFYYLIDVLLCNFTILLKIVYFYKSMIFYTYLCTLMFFVSSLRKGKLKKQFSLFSLIHLIGYSTSVSSRSAIRNINSGKFWFFFPSTLVICNDIFAYVIGKSFGRHQLYRLSPKKTIEGFIGGFLFTLVYGFALCYLQIKYSIFAEIYLNELNAKQEINFYVIKFHVSAIFIHVIPFIFFASFIAPFSGFLGSALKRAYNVKDFGASIPGHGGMADRFDCQLIMAVFTSIYLKTFLKTKAQSLMSIFLYIIGKHSHEEIMKLKQMLQNYLDNPEYTI